MPATTTTTPTKPTMSRNWGRSVAYHHHRRRFLGRPLRTTWLRTPMLRLPCSSGPVVEARFHQKPPRRPVICAGAARDDISQRVQPLQPRERLRLRLASSSNWTTRNGSVGEWNEQNWHGGFNNSKLLWQTGLKGKLRKSRQVSYII